MKSFSTVVMVVLMSLKAQLVGVTGSFEAAGGFDLAPGSPKTEVIFQARTTLGVAQQIHGALTPISFQSRVSGSPCVLKAL